MDFDSREDKFALFAMSWVLKYDRDKDKLFRFINSKYALDWAMIFKSDKHKASLLIDNGNDAIFFARQFNEYKEAMIKYISTTEDLMLWVSLLK